MKIKKKSILVLFAFIFVFSLMFGTVSMKANAIDPSPLEDEVIEYPIQAEYDFNIPGSTISFLDINGNLIEGENNWYEGESIVHNWHIFMYRSEKNNLKLGYSSEGKLFLPHKVYEGESADLLYVKDNNLFRVSATKEETQIFDGREILKTISLVATNGETTLANAPIFAETPFGFKFMGITDTNGNFSVNATTGEFKLWITSNAGFIVNKTVTISDSTTEISFADEITNAVEVDITARSETYTNAPGYVVLVGKVNETVDTNMLSTSYLSPDKTVKLTPGTYSISCGIYLKDVNSYYSTNESGGLWIDLSKNIEIKNDTTFDFSMYDFEGKYAIQDEYEQESYGIADLMAYRFYAEHQNGYSMPARIRYDDYSSSNVIVNIEENSYPYTFSHDPFSMLYDTFIYTKEDETTPILELNDSDIEFSLPYDFFGDTEKEYIIKYYPKWESMSFPEIFPTDVFYSTTFKTKATSLNEETYKEFESLYYFQEVYYTDENGVQQNASYDYRDDRYFYYIPESVKNGTYLFAVDYSYMKTDYAFIEVNDALFESPYEFTPHTNFSAVTFNVQNGVNDENEYSIGFNALINIGNQKFNINYLEAGTQLPYGTYIFNVNAYCELYDEEYYELLGASQISILEEYTLSEEEHIFTVDYSSFKSFTIDASAFYSDDYYFFDNYRKQLALHYEDGNIIFVDWFNAPINIYLKTLPEYATGEMYYYALEETQPFSPYISLEKFEIEENKTYKFDFKPTGIEILSLDTFESNEEIILTYKVTDGFGNIINDIWNLLNNSGVHNPLRSREYPFRDENGNPIDYQYTVDVYYRLIGTTEYEKISFTDFSKANLGMLVAGEYEGYVEVNLDCYLDEFLVEYPVEKGIYYDEYWGEFNSVYENIKRVLHGVLRDEFTFEVVENTHEHDWSDWEKIDENNHQHTCNNEDCPIQTESAPHNWDNGTETKPPKCEEDGEITYTCLDCGATKTESIEKLEHDWSDWTYNDEQSHIRECKRECGVEIDYDEHSWSDWIAFDDEVHQMTCPACSGHREEEHDWNDGEVTKEPKETEEGEMTFTCLVCSHTKTEPIEKLVHNPEFVPENPAKCEESGHIEHYYCENCNKYFSDEAGTIEIDDITIEALDHDWGDWVYDSVDSHIRECKRNCGVTEENEGHEWSNWTAINDDEHQMTCPICSGHREENHDWNDGEITKEASCYEEGEITYTCLTCLHTRTEPIEKLEHTFTDWTPDGNENHKRTCMDEQCEEFEILPHDYDNGLETEPATHTKTGTMTYTCEVCSHTYTEDIPMLTNHKWGEWIINKEDNSTHIHYCICEKFETEAHHFDNGVETEPATHTSKGKLTFTCEDCGYSYDEDIPEKTEHEWTDWSSNGDGTHTRACRCNDNETNNCTYDNGVETEKPSHTKVGTMTYTCTVCGHTYTEDIPKTTEHSWDEWIINKEDNSTHIRYCICEEFETEAHHFDNGVETEPATHTSKGKLTFTCEDCGYSYDEDIPEKTEHEWTDWSSNGDGTHTRACRCNDNETNDCSYNNGVVTTKPTNEKPGEKTFTCTVCGHTYTEEVAKVEEITSSNNSDIKISVEQGSSAILVENTVINVQEVSPVINESLQAKIEVVGGDNAEFIASYDISLLLDEVEVQPGGKVAVTLPIPQTTTNYSNLQVVYIDDEGNVTPCKTRINEDGTITFVTDHFSHYAIIGVNTDANKGLGTGAIVTIVIISIIVLSIGGFALVWFVIKKKTWADFISLFKKGEAKQ